MFKRHGWTRSQAACFLLYLFKNNTLSFGIYFLFLLKSGFQTVNGLKAGGGLGSGEEEERLDNPVSASRFHTSTRPRLLYLSFGLVCCTLEGFGSAGELGKNIKRNLYQEHFFVFLGGTINAAPDRN